MTPNILWGPHVLPIDAISFFSVLSKKQFYTSTPPELKFSNLIKLRRSRLWKRERQSSRMMPCDGDEDSAVRDQSKRASFRSQNASKNVLRRVARELSVAKRSELARRPEFLVEKRVKNIFAGSRAQFIEWRRVHQSHGQSNYFCTCTPTRTKRRAARTQTSSSPGQISSRSDKLFEVFLEFAASQASVNPFCKLLLFFSRSVLSYVLRKSS